MTKSAAGAYAIPAKVTPWLLSIRPKVLTASIIPVLAGTLLAIGSGAAISWSISLIALLVAFCIQIGTHFINDALDNKKGVDTASRLGPLRGVQLGQLSAKQVYSAGLGMFALALIIGIPLIIQGGWPIALLLAASVACGYLYTAGPMPFSYSGLGDFLVLPFYGLASTAAVFYLQTGAVSDAALLAGAQIGMIATALHAINNLRDIREDAKGNKRTLAVRYGVTFAKCEITFMVLLPYVFNLFWFELDYELAAILPWLTLPLAYSVVNNIWLNPPGRLYNNFLAQCALLHLAFGILLALGFL